MQQAPASLQCAMAPILWATAIGCRYLVALLGILPRLHEHGAKRTHGRPAAGLPAAQQMHHATCAKVLCLQIALVDTAEVIILVTQSLSTQPMMLLAYLHTDLKKC